MNTNISKINPNELMKKMDHALQFGTQDDLMSLFAEGIDIDQTDYEGRTALMVNAAKGIENTVKMLIKEGANINHVFMYQDRIPKTALDAARECNRYGIGKLLEENGAKTGAELEQKQ